MCPTNPNHNLLQGDRGHMPTREPFLEHVPKQGWLAEYIEWTMGSESPAPYHFFVGCAVLGSSMGRKVWFNMGYYKLYPNTQILLVGPTGAVKKTSAINLGLTLMRKVKVKLIAAKTTPEALISELDSEPPIREGKVFI